jgi:hypothetical protein
VTGAVVDESENAAEPGPVPGSVVITLPSVTTAEGAALALQGDLAPAGNPDVPERLFALLDAAQTSITGKESAHRVLTGHDAASAVPALAALDLERPLFDAIVELLLADPAP